MDRADLGREARESAEYWLERNPSATPDGVPENPRDDDMWRDLAWEALLNAMGDGSRLDYSRLFAAVRDDPGILGPETAGYVDGAMAALADEFVRTGLAALADPGSLDGRETEFDRAAAEFARDARDSLEADLRTRFAGLGPEQLAPAMREADAYGRDFSDLCSDAASAASDEVSRMMRAEAIRMLGD